MGIFKEMLEELKELDGTEIRINRIINVDQIVEEISKEQRDRIRRLGVK